MFTIEVTPSDEQEEENVQLDWIILSKTPSLMKIKLMFEQPLFISYYKPDIVKVNFADSDLFISTDGIKIPEKNRIIVRELMRQLPDDA